MTILLRPGFLTDRLTVASPALTDGSAVYTHGLGLTSERRNDATGVYHLDGLGSTRFLTNAGQAITASIAYDAFGVPLSRRGDNPTPFGFGGGFGAQTDADSGLIADAAGIYDPGIGRWLGPTRIHWETGSYLGDVGEVAKGIGDALNPVNWWDGLKNAASQINKGGWEGAKRVGGEFISGLNPFGQDSLRDMGRSLGGDLMIVAPFVKRLPSPGLIPWLNRARAKPATCLTRGPGSPVPTPDYVVTPNGTVVPIPDGWIGRVADNGKGLVFKDPVNPLRNGSQIRIADPTPIYPEGYGRVYNPLGQPISPVTGKPGLNPATHIPFDGTAPPVRWPFPMRLRP